MQKDPGFTVHVRPKNKPRNTRNSLQTSVIKLCQDRAGQEYKINSKVFIDSTFGTTRAVWPNSVAMLGKGPRTQKSRDGRIFQKDSHLRNQSGLYCIQRNEVSDKKKSFISSTSKQSTIRAQQLLIAHICTVYPPCTYSVHTYIIHIQYIYKYYCMRICNHFHTLHSLCRLHYQCIYATLKFQCCFCYSCYH